MRKSPNIISYRIAQFVSNIVAKIIFKRQVKRNEINGVQGPYVVIANHECAYDFVNLIGLNKRPMCFVISNSFYSTMPCKWFFNSLGVLPKQQFQVSLKALKDMKYVLESGTPLVIYPAGLMSEDGRSTPIPKASYKFLKWLGVDVYVARITGSYFVMPKWSSGFNPGTTTIDVFKLFGKEDLERCSEEEIKSKVRKELLFDAYKEQENLKYHYARKGEITGLKDVLYMCPNCKKEFSIYEKDQHTLICSECGYESFSDDMYMLHRKSSFGPDYRYVSEWSRFIQEEVMKNLLEGKESFLSDEVEIQTINHYKHKFETIGEGVVVLDKDSVTLSGDVSGEKWSIKLSTLSYASLPFSPAKYFEIQDGETIYRLLPRNRVRVMKYINTIKCYYRINNKIEDEIE